MNITMDCADIKVGLRMIDESTLYLISDFIKFLLALIIRFDSFRYYLGKFFGIINQGFEPVTEISKDRKVIAIAKETTGFAVIFDLTDVGIIFKCLTKCCFPLITITVGIEATLVLNGFANLSCICIERFLSIVAEIAMEERESKAETILTVFVINNIERSVGLVKVFNLLRCVHDISLLIPF